MLVILNNTHVDFDAAVAIMDDNIRENIHANLAPCGEQTFIDAYAIAHEEEFHFKFILN
jgi:hypothetical protein